MTGPSAHHATGRLHGKVALVTGAGSGIGAAIARRFAAEGARLALLDLPGADLSAVIADIEAHGHGALALQADVTDAGTIRDSVRATLARFERIDILINCAGINVFRDPVALIAEDWRRCLAVNLEGAWNCIQAALPAMLSRSYGHIVNVASVHGHKIIPGAFPYPVAKHGLIGLTRSLGIEYAARGIRVNSVSPGLIMTPAAEAWLASCPDPQAERRRQAELIPCKRVGMPEEVAMTVLFLAGDEARFVNATDILIDGGRSQIYHD